MPRHLLAALFAVSALAAGCGEGEPEATRGGAPAITTGLPYELGGADGSGADGEEEAAPRGGIASGPDTREPGDSQDGDSPIKPPR